MWPFTKKKDVDLVSAKLREEVAIADPAIFTDEELEIEIIKNLNSGYFKDSSVFSEYINRPSHRGVSRPYVENEIRRQHPDDRKFWSLALNPFLNEE